MRGPSSGETIRSLARATSAVVALMFALTSCVSQGGTAPATSSDQAGRASHGTSSSRPSSSHPSSAKPTTSKPTSGAGDRVKAKDLGLPHTYDVTYDDSYGDTHTESMRRDLGEYLIAVRTHDRATADYYASDLQAVPVAWCSYWLPKHTLQELNTWLSAAHRRVAKTAAALGSKPRYKLTPARADLLSYARTLAAHRFCPAQAAHPGHQAGQPGKAARPPKDDDGFIERTDIALSFPERYEDGGAGYDPGRIPTDEVEATYLVLMMYDASNYDALPILSPYDDFGDHCEVLRDAVNGAQDRQAIANAKDDSSYDTYANGLDGEYLQSLVVLNVFADECR